MDLRIVGFLLLGIAIGVPLRSLPRIAPVAGRLLTTGTVYALVFLLGASVGANPAVMTNLGAYGVQALVLCLGGVLGSLIFARLVALPRSASPREE
jgi:hypothetical protein